jgi:hypothetical protein
MKGSGSGTKMCRSGNTVPATSQNAGPSDFEHLLDGDAPIAVTVQLWRDASKMT